MEISLNKVIRAISIALDLSQMSSVDGTNIIEEVTNIHYSKHKFMNHSLRTCYIAIEIGRELNIPENKLQLLYISSLLHDIGATNFFNASHHSNDFIYEHSIMGSNLTKEFPLFNNLSDIILYHHENYDGSGSLKLSGENIPLESQIIRISDLIELLFKESQSSLFQKDRIVQWIKENNNKIYSSKITEAFLRCSRKDIFWFNLENLNSMNFILDNVAPKMNLTLNLLEFEKVAYIFSSIIDNKDDHTASHSLNIGELAYNVSKHLKYDEEKCKKMKIAGLLHDIGKLAIPIKILNKNSGLTNDEFNIIKSHVYYSKIILDRIEDIPDISDWASNHHEKLDGTGYPRGLKAHQLNEESRIIAICDIYQALTESRPYKQGFSHEKTFEIMNSMADRYLICSKALGYLKETIGYNDL
ncbi:HD domain-containing phosphohydrolase [uncultured Clostridium sp.]|uniref:HD-GYP domain-containing protein n=1 Tax=uncultured Clostridium sp. TaxID=59620 RepID=UPI0028EE3466|nr:HD domain-containing phosphohydrolase [uncultured Clostridium sp.]